MQKKNRFTVDPGKAVLSAAVSVFLFLLAATMLPLGRYESAVIFGVIGIVFSGIAVRALVLVGFDREGVYEQLFGISIRRFRWEEIKEAGVCGTKVFHKEKAKKTGRRFLYFSTETLDKQKRFEMILKWPPRRQIYLIYAPDRVVALRIVWDGKLEMYNEGDLEL